MKREIGTVRLADRILADGVRFAHHASDASVANIAQEIQKRIATAIIIEAREVFGHYWADHTNEVWKLKTDFPNVALPFPSMFFEARMAGLRCKGMETQVKDMGVLVEGEALSWDSIELLTKLPIPKGHTFIELSLGHIQKLAGQGILRKEDAPYWGMQLHSVMAPHSGGVFYGGTMAVVANRMGCVVHENIPVVSPASASQIEHFGMDRLADGVSHSVLPALLAICFMHCKNINLQPNEPNPKLSKAFQKRHGRPLLRYHTLEIEPMKQVLESEGGASKNGLKKALHICRGHFAHYTPDKPLFGKVTGTIWKQAHVRGSISEGMVAKDYKIKAPAL